MEKSVRRRQQIRQAVERYRARHPEAVPRESLRQRGRRWLNHELHERGLAYILVLRGEGPLCVNAALDRNDLLRPRSPANRFLFPASVWVSARRYATAISSAEPTPDQPIEVRVLGMALIGCGRRCSVAHTRRHRQDYRFEALHLRNPQSIERDLLYNMPVFFSVKGSYRSESFTYAGSGHYCDWPRKADGINEMVALKTGAYASGKLEVRDER
jgi:hypothetical protein